MKRSLIAAMVVLGAVAARGENWANWRGPNGNGAVGPSGAPRAFSAEENVLWKIKLPGRACSTPVVWGDRIFVTTAIGEEDGVVAYDWSGKELWRKTLGPLKPGRGQRVGSSANSSPVTDGERVYVYFKSGNVGALTVDGELLWKKNLQDEYGPDKLWWDQGSSPVLAGGHLVVPVMQTEGNSYLVAFKPESGEVAWFTPRQYDVAKESGDSYTTPHVVDIGGVETIVCWGADHLDGYEAKTGKKLWESAGFNPEKKGMWRVIASSVVTDGVAVVPFARGEALGALKLDGSGAESDEDWLWRHDGLGSDAATPVAANGRVIVVKDGGKERGTVTCLDVHSGEVLWEDNFPKSVHVFYGSPVLAGKVLYVPREDGTILTATVTDEGLEEVRENPLGEGVIASPVIVNDKLLLRGDTHLFCIGK